MALLIVGILAGVALPTYGSYVQRSKIFEATITLMDMRMKLTQYLRDRGQLPDACVTPAAGTPPAGSISVPRTQYFDIACRFSSPTTYTLTATGRRVENMGEFVYTVDQANMHRTVRLPVGWEGAGSACWITNSGGKC